MNPEHASTPVLSPDFAPDFAEKVLRAADRARARQRLGRGFLLAVVVAGLWFVPRHAVNAPPLRASDFAWLEQIGVQPSDPDTLLFPEIADASDENGEDDDSGLLASAL